MLGVGMWLGYFIQVNLLSCQLFEQFRPPLRLGKSACRVVTEEEYLWLLATGRLRDVD